MNKTEELKDRFFAEYELKGKWLEDVEGEITPKKIWEYFEPHLSTIRREAYLQGVKDFQIATSLPISDYGDANYVLRMQDIKAQQFIDSLGRNDNGTICGVCSKG